MSSPAAAPPLPGPFTDYRPLSDAELAARIEGVRQRMGRRLVILGHHYQQDGVIAHADFQGDSYQLSRSAAERDECEAIAFCGVHFMAETADILANRPDKVAARGGRRVAVVLPDLAAGCSMADMAAIHQVEDAWADLGTVIDTAELTPVTYINSAASLKAFCGRHGGIVCTSSNARAVLEWAFARGRRVLFFPDQHLGRNTARTMGIGLDQMCVWNPHEPELGGNSTAALEASRVILWQGHCSVHAMFRPEHVDGLRKNIPGVKILVHPECSMEVVDKADLVGSTSYILRQVEQAAPGTKWAIGTELHLVKRLEAAHPEQEIHFLSPVVCMCATMYRIDLAHLCWSLEHLEAGDAVNVIRVEDETAKWAVVALERMLAVA
ncbi:MAG: quinolinate synthase NadA [Planctomycetota bacterium]|jgi:quinolinate synthase|nr:quinolinate synthase NadA [Planctomycetota bacterium]